MIQEYKQMQTHTPMYLPKTLWAGIPSKPILVKLFILTVITKFRKTTNNILQCIQIEAFAKKCDIEIICLKKDKRKYLFKKLTYDHMSNILLGSVSDVSETELYSW